MSRWALITDGQVANVIEADADLIESTFADRQAVELPEGSEVGVGWLHENDTFFRLPLPPEVPASLPRKQARQALLAYGITFDTIRAAVAGSQLGATEKEAVLIELEEATNFERHNPVLLQAAALMGLTPQQLDEMFISGASL